MDDNDNMHHEQQLFHQKKFKQHVQAVNLADTINAMGNPFMDTCAELLIPDSRNYANDEVVKTITVIEDVGKEQYDKYVKTVIVDRDVSIHNTLKKNSLKLLKHPNVQKDSKKKKQISNWKNDYSLFSKLYIASKYRDSNLGEFFSYENHPWPPSLSQDGKLRLPSKKSDLLKVMDIQDVNAPTSFQVKIFDVAVNESTLYGIFTSQTVPKRPYRKSKELELGVK
jgi:hypothetical protein